tara:strand:- start:4460 stop:5953 length:1494 start_codon:yes stop_codon:yes gene_type:complete
MKDLLAKLAELDKDIKTINETTNPLGETASMNISMTGDNADEVAQLVNIMRTGNTPDAKQIGPMDMPPSDHMPMDKALSIVKMPMDGPMDMDGPMHGMDGPTDSPMDDMPQMDPKDDEADEDMSGGFSSSTTEPDEQYFDTQTMTHDLAGGINRTKKQHAPAADGDNPIAVEDDLDAQIESIKDELYAALAEKKKPDADGDGVPDWADKKPGEDDHADDKADIDEGAMSNIHAEIEAADDRAQATMELIDKGGPEGKYLYNELEKLAAKQGTTLSVDDEGSMPEDFIGDLLDDMGISAYKDEADTEDTSYSIKGKSEEANAELARIAELSGISAPDEKADEDTSYSIKGKSEEANAELARIAELSGISAPDEKADEDTSYSIKGKSEEANAELARIANVDEWETDPEEHNQAAIESWHDEVVSAITDRNITFPIADNEIQKIADDVVDDWSNGYGPDEHTILSIIDNENSQVNQDQKDEATLEHEATLEAIRNISFR